MRNSTIPKWIHTFIQRYRFLYKPVKCCLLTICFFRFCGKYIVRKLGRERVWRMAVFMTGSILVYTVIPSFITSGMGDESIAEMPLNAGEDEQLTVSGNEYPYPEEQETESEDHESDYEQQETVPEEQEDASPEQDISPTESEAEQKDQEAVSPEPDLEEQKPSPEQTEPAKPETTPEQPDSEEPVNEPEESEPVPSGEPEELEPELQEPEVEEPEEMLDSELSEGNFTIPSELDNQIVVDDAALTEDILKVDIPTQGLLTIDPYNLLGEGQILSPDFQIKNQSSFPVEVELSSVDYSLNTETWGTLVKDCDLYFNVDEQRITFAPGHSENVEQFHLEQGEFLKYHFTGKLSQNTEALWKPGDIRLRMVFRFNKADEAN